MRGPAWTALAVLLAALCFAPPAPAGETGEAAGATVEITAETMSTRGTVFEAAGSVVIRQLDSVLRADRVTYDSATQEAIAEGNVSYEDPSAKVTASRAEINLRTRTGVLYDADVLLKKGSYRVFGPRIEKRTDNAYFLDVGSVTTCAGPVPDWCVRGRDVDLVIGKRVTTRNATFLIKNKPVLYAPYLWAPVLVERQTGFLPPKVGFTEDRGVNYMQPFFWAMSENRDATLTLDFYSRSGVGLGGQYRYVEAPGIEGSLNAYHIHDSRLHRDYSEFRGVHRHRREWFRGFYDINLVSQADFYRQYAPELPHGSSRFLESQAEASARVFRHRLYVRGRYAQDLLDGANDRATMQKLPEVGFFHAPTRFGPVVLTAEAAFANFTRDEGPDGDRMDMRLGLLTTLGGGAGPAFTQRLGLRESVYDINGGADNTFGRSMLDYNAELRASLGRRYGNLTHVVMPSVTYDYRSAELKPTPLLDEVEELDNISLLGVSVLNRLMDEGGEFLTVRLSEKYDFTAGHRPFQPATLELRYHRVLDLTLSLDYDVYDNRFVKSASQMVAELQKVRLKGGHSFERGGETMYNFAVEYSPTDVFALKGDIWYDSSGGGLSRLGAGVLYNGQCWSVSLDFSKRPSEYQVFLMVTLKGFKEFRLEHVVGGS